MNVLHTIASQIQPLVQHHMERARDIHISHQILLKKIWIVLSFVIPIPFCISGFCGILSAREFLVGVYILMALECGLAYLYLQNVNTFQFLNSIDILFEVIDIFTREPQPFSSYQSISRLVMNAVLDEPVYMEWSEDLQDGITHEGFRVGDVVYILDENHTTPVSHTTLMSIFYNRRNFEHVRTTRNPFTNLPVTKITKKQLVVSSL